MKPRLSVNLWVLHFSDKISDEVLFFCYFTQWNLISGDKDWQFKKFILILTFANVKPNTMFQTLDSLKLVPQYTMHFKYLSILKILVLRQFILDF